jgi:hypothetical protein
MLTDSFKSEKSMVITLIVVIILIIMAILIHSQALLWLSKLIKRIRMHPMWKMVIGVFGTLCAHLFEIWIFSWGYYFLVQSGKYGALAGDYTHGFRDCNYYSLIVYSSLGFGNITPRGPIRFLSGIEVLTGLVMFAWTASFLFIRMQRLWDTLRKS